MKWLLVFLTLVLIVLHQDWWNWSKVDPLLFNFVPVGIWYHALFCVAAAILLWLFDLLAWPRHLENVEPEPGVAKDDRSTGH